MTGLAIASDTLATLRVGSAFKVSHGHSKIFTPSADHQFVVYHSGSSAINNVPVRLHIDAWFKSLTKQLPTIDAYVANYKKFCESTKSPHTKTSEREVLLALSDDIVKIARENIENETGDLKNKLEDPESRKLWNEALIAEAKAGLDFYKQVPRFEGFNETYTKEIISKLKVTLKAPLKFHFSEGYPPRFASMLTRAFAFRVASKVESSLDFYLTFSGFGAKDLYPVSRRINLRGVIAGKLQSDQDHDLTIESEGKSLGIVYGAQFDAMYGVIQGYRKIVETHVHNTITAAMPDLPELQTLANDVVTEMQTITARDYVNPAFRRIANFSLSELAETAKDLVNLQILSAKLSGTSETVGGEIEYLTIDRSTASVGRTVSKEGKSWENTKFAT
jgi:hypothetical protein